MTDRPPSLERDHPVEFSVIITCYFEERSIDEFWRQLSEAMNSSARSYEILFVNDGSRDHTFDRLKKIFARDAKVHAVLDLFKNSGQGAAMAAGIAHARGRHFAFLDSDLQLSPTVLGSIVRDFTDDDDIATGYRERRRDSLWRIVPSWLANAIMRRVSQTRLKDFGCNAKVVHGNLVRSFDFGPKKAWRWAPLLRQAGRIREIPVPHRSRKFGKSGWTFAKLWRYNVDNIVRLSDRPFQLLTVACALSALAFVIRILLSWFNDFQLIPNVTTGLLLNILVVMLLIIVSILSSIGELVIRNFLILQDEPVYVIRELLTRSDDDTAAPREGGV